MLEGDEEGEVGKIWLFGNWVRKERFREDLGEGRETMQLPQRKCRMKTTRVCFSATSAENLIFFSFSSKISISPAFLSVSGERISFTADILKERWTGIVRPETTDRAEGRVLLRQSRVTDSGEAHRIRKVKHH